MAQLQQDWSQRGTRKGTTQKSKDLNWDKSIINLAAAAAAKSLQYCPTLCHPRDGSPPGSPVPGILQAGTLEWVTISFSSAWKWKVKVKSLSRVLLLATPWTAAYQAPPHKGFSRQKYWSGVPLPSLLENIKYLLFSWFLHLPFHLLNLVIPLLRWNPQCVKSYNNHHLTQGGHS